MSDSYLTLFGGLTRTRILMSLCIDGPAGRRELGRRLSIDPEQALDRLRSLERCGIIKRTSRAPWLNVYDWSFPSSGAIASFLSVIRGGDAVAVGDQYDLLHEYASNGTEHRTLFGSVPRTMVLLGLGRLGVASAPEIARYLGISVHSVRSSLLIFERLRIIRRDMCSGRTTFRLEPEHPHYGFLISMLTHVAEDLGISA